jgi:hypothetical protein
MIETKMMNILTDTSPEIERLQIEQLRRMPCWRKLALVSEMNQTVRMLALTGLRQRYPDDSPTQYQRRLADLTLGIELAIRAYGPRPVEE